MAAGIEFSQPKALNGVRFSTAKPLVVPQLSTSKPSLVHNGFHHTPQDAFAFLMLMNAMAEMTIATQWGTARTHIDRSTLIVDIPSFGRYVDDAMSFRMSPLVTASDTGIEAELDYSCRHFSIQQLATVDDVNTGTGVSTIAIRIGATLLSKAAVLKESELRQLYPDVHFSIIRSGMCLANAYALGSTFSDDCVIKADNPKTEPRTNSAVGATTMPGHSVDEHGLYRDEEAPRFSVTYIHPRDAKAQRGSPLRKSYIHIVENVPFTRHGLKWAHAPLVEDLMVAAAYMRPHMLPYEGIFTPRS